MSTLLVQITYATLTTSVNSWYAGILQVDPPFCNGYVYSFILFFDNYLMSSYYVQLNKQNSCSHVTFISKER